MAPGLGISQRPPADGPVTDPDRTEDGTPARAGLRGWVEGHRKVVLLGAGSVLVLCAGAAALLLSNPTDDPGGGPVAAVTRTAPTPSGSATSTSTATASATPAQVTGTRNPFAAPAQPGSGSATPAPAGTGGSTAAPTGATGGGTGAAPAAYLALFSVASDGAAKFALNATAYTRTPGDSFGVDDAVTYLRKVTVAGARCAVISYEGQSVTLCPGEMQRLD